MTSFIAADFDIPMGLNEPDFTVRPLTIHDAVKDYDAVMSSRMRLAGLFGPGDAWPAADLSLEQNLIDLAWHQKEFQIRRSFAYTVMRPDESQCLGCVYVEPSPKRGYDAQLFFWVRNSEHETGLEARLDSALRRWLTDAWAFKRVARPGRDIDWLEWQALADV